MTKIAILQSNYLPWKGVFDLINRVDVFVFLEDAQYTKRDWRNRNRIVTSHGPQWITVPVKNKGRFLQKLSEVQIETSYDWQRKHFTSFERNYSKAPFFDENRWIIEQIYLEKEWESLSELNIFTTKLLCQTLDIKTKFLKSYEIHATGEKNERIIEICRSLKSSCYVSGPSARSYINQKKFQKNGIEIEYMRYQYPEYRQLYGTFCHQISIMDVIFNCGPEASMYIRSK